MDDGRLALLLALGGTRRWKKGQTLFAAGDPVDMFYKLTKGIVAIYREFENGQRQIVGVHTVGDLCGYLQRNGSYSFSAEAITDVEACAFNRRRFDAFVVQHPDLSSALLTDITEKLMQVSENIAANGKLPAPERLAHFLLQLARLFEGQKGKATAALAFHASADRRKSGPNDRNCEPVIHKAEERQSYRLDRRRHGGASRSDQTCKNGRLADGDLAYWST